MLLGTISIWRIAAPHSKYGLAALPERNAVVRLGLRPRWPYSSRTRLPLSTTEWIFAVDPVIAVATNFAAAIPRLAARAP
jgi:hypothetical protein